MITTRNSDSACWESLLSMVAKWTKRSSTAGRVGRGPAGRGAPGRRDEEPLHGEADQEVPDEDQRRAGARPAAHPGPPAARTQPPPLIFAQRSPSERSHLCGPSSRGGERRVPPPRGTSPLSSVTGRRQPRTFCSGAPLWPRSQSRLGRLLSSNGLRRWMLVTSRPARTVAATGRRSILFQRAHARLAVIAWSRASTCPRTARSYSLEQG